MDIISSPDVIGLAFHLFPLDPIKFVTLSINPGGPDRSARSSIDLQFLLGIYTYLTTLTTGNTYISIAWSLNLPIHIKQT
jgi:hypothetical protein